MTLQFVLGSTWNFYSCNRPVVLTLVPNFFSFLLFLYFSLSTATTKLEGFQSERLLEDIGSDRSSLDDRAEGQLDRLVQVGHLV